MKIKNLNQICCKIAPNMNEITNCKKKERGKGEIWSCLRKIRQGEIYCMKNS